MAVRELTRWVTAPPALAAFGESRRLTARTYALLWGGLSMSMLAFLPGAYLVPALTLRDAVVVALLGSAAGAAMLGAVAAVATKRGQNTVGLLSSALGVPAGTLFATFLLLRHVTWATFALAFATEAATHVPGAGDAAVLWGIAFGAVGLVLALLPAQTFVRRWMGWFAFWVGLLLIALITLTGVVSYGIPVLHDADGMGGWPTVAQGFDLVAAMPLLWLPVVADYTRDARSPRDAGLGAFAGAAVITAWFVIVGALWVFTVNARDVAAFVTALPLGVGGLVVILALEADQVAANVYAASMAGGRFGYRYFRPALMAAGALAAVFVVTTNAMGVEDFALMLSNLFLPLFGVVVARHLIPEAPKAFAWAAWIAGILAFGWIDPSTVGPWHDVMKVVYVGILQAPFPLGGELTQVPATAVSLAVAFGGYLLVSWPWWFFRKE
ncbi:MAG TPA: hypothetical protein VNM43_02605, partial [Dehalococcoidia bacterium]|nr:hypothetical protein [Dehalococcoidia bacterium]